MGRCDYVWPRLDCQRHGLRRPHQLRRRSDFAFRFKSHWFRPLHSATSGFITLSSINIDGNLSCGGSEEPEPEPACPFSILFSPVSLLLQIAFPVITGSKKCQRARNCCENLRSVSHRPQFL